ncbi:MAG: N-acetylmuramoyl-L-alanine amidase, partial [Prolixibacteraceae bacterium]|nr:N-acetylmuramoyl-L-alanine amidase [Prolixibacteraceae bacterium]
MKTIFLIFFLATIVLPGMLNAQQKEVVAEKGDGIYRLLTRHGLSISEHTNAFIELNKNLLGKDNTLVSGVKYKLPGAVKNTQAKSNIKTTSFEIFGKKYADVEITGNDLNGAIYYLMAGHGGPDPGAVGKYNNKQLCEDEYAYDVTLRLARKLIQNGA